MCFNSGGISIDKMLTNWLFVTSSLVYIVCTQSPSEDRPKEAHDCYPVAFFKYTNPKVTGTSGLIHEFDTSKIFKRTLQLDCTKENLFVDISNVVLSIPQRKEDFCPEEKRQENKQKCYERCPCCKTTASRCEEVVHDEGAISEEYFKACNGKKQCNITVESRYLRDCQDIDYTCENQCQSRWVDVEYYCRPAEEVLMMKEPSGTP